LTQEITLENLYVMFIFCKQTDNFDGNENGTRYNIKVYCSSFIQFNVRTCFQEQIIYESRGLLVTTMTMMATTTTS